MVEGNTPDPLIHLTLDPQYTFWKNKSAIPTFFKGKVHNQTADQTPSAAEVAKVLEPKLSTNLTNTPLGVAKTLKQRVGIFKSFFIYAFLWNPIHLHYPVLLGWTQHKNQQQIAKNISKTRKKNIQQEFLSERYVKPTKFKVKLKKDNGDGSFDIMWLEDEAEDTAQLEDLKHLPGALRFVGGDVLGPIWDCKWPSDI